MAEYKGSSGDGNRIRMLEKQRENEIKEINKKKEKFKEEKKANVFSIHDKFQSVSDSSSTTSTQFQNVGLVSINDFNNNIKSQNNLNDKNINNKRLSEKEMKKKSIVNKKLKITQKSKLSFELDDDDDDDDDNNDDNNSNNNENQESQGNEDIEKKENKTENENKEETETENINNNNNNKNKIKFFGKDPSVNTDFLPDIEREELEKSEREKLAKKWLDQQEKIKAEEFEITYSFWDGSGHRRSMKCSKGTTIERFLENARKEFKELRGVSVDKLMFIKEDIIIPHNYSFYDLMLTKARGKSGPLFRFDVHEDVRLVNDATVEKEESHAAKMVESSWYERNKHIFPSSRWEYLAEDGFDTQNADRKYTISDRLAKH
ncbi:hypothetical protein RB653_006455 [Dictyostelium firmibasis]|uniref:FAM50A/XAP5 C-terminal domain-containing protein n=1 Tax=Dictyostelium firmibasis TaxID=79012 RepID=A0AAN7UMP3_9MYCE